MKLQELSGEYRRSARLLSERLRLLRRQKKEESDERQRDQLQRRIYNLTQMLGQMNELAELTEHYYERGYRRNEKYRL